LVGVWLLKERPRLAKDDEDDEDRRESKDQETAETAAAQVLPLVEKTEVGTLPAQHDKAWTPRLEVAVMMMVMKKARPMMAE
jgi:hypothetical protein